jgi:hypothetical protein
MHGDDNVTRNLAQDAPDGEAPDDDVEEDDSIFDFLKLLTPGAMLSVESCTSMVLLVKVFLKQMDTDAKATLLTDISGLIYYLINLDQSGSVKKASLPKKPVNDVVRFLNIFGSLILAMRSEAISQRADFENMPHATLSLVGSDEDILLPLYDVSGLVYIHFTNSLVPICS